MMGQLTLDNAHGGDQTLVCWLKPTGLIDIQIGMSEDGHAKGICCEEARYPKSHLMNTSVKKPSKKKVAAKMSTRNKLIAKKPTKKVKR